MARVEFMTFQEASEFSRKLSISSKTSIRVHRDGHVWWVDAPETEADRSNRTASPAKDNPTPKLNNLRVDRKNRPQALLSRDPGMQKIIRTLAELPGHLNHRVIGQDEPIETICKRLRIAYSGLSTRTGPVAVFLCLGPSGVGKTEMAKALAEHLLGGEESLIRIDMSEYMEEHSISKLIGSPPGYVGYDKEGQLTGKLTEHPRSVLLLDEVEKAHPRVMDIFLQLFGEGRLTNAKGETVDAKEALVIMTSNIRIKKNARIGFGVGACTSGKIQQEVLKKYFRIELVNRISEVVVFNNLGRDSIRRILAPMLDEIRVNLLKLTGTELSVGKDVIEFLINEGCSPDFGVRELKRTVEHHLQGGLGELIVNGELQTVQTISACMVNGKVALVLDEINTENRPELIGQLKFSGCM